MCEQEEMWSKRIAYIVDNSILRHEDANTYNKMQISDKEVLMRIKTLFEFILTVLNKMNRSDLLNLGDINGFKNPIEFFDLGEVGK